MSQSSLLGKDYVEKSLGTVVSKMRIKIPHFDNSALIKGYAKTMIGRCMNPRKQDMKGLLLMFPRICQVEGRVAGADLGLGRFQLDFDEEEDIAEVLKMEPFHFDGWMVSLVRWKPSVDPSYPSTLTFWVRVLGIPIEYWAHPTFESIGDALGKVVEVDINGGRVQVILDGFKPLCFETTIEFGSGEETLVSLRYERLFGYCSYCFSLCHDVEHCEKKHGVRVPTAHSLVGADGAGAHSWSYKGVVIQDRQPKHGSEGKGKGIATGKDREEERNEPSNLQVTDSGKGKQSRFVQGEGSSRYKRFTNYANFNDHRFNEQKRLKAKAKEASKVKMADPTEVQVAQSVAIKPKKIVRKVLVFEDEVDRVPEQSLVQPVQDGQVGSEAGIQMEVPADPASMDQAVPLTDFEMGDPSLDNAALDAVDDLVMNLSDEGVMAEGETELEFEADFVSDPTLIASLDQIVADSEIDALKLAEEELGHVEEEENLVSNADQESATTKINDKGKGKAGSVAKKKAGKGLVLPGVATRKRFVQAMVSPRKRYAPMYGPNPGEDKFPPNQGPENGGPGGSQAPNPAA